MDKPAKKSLTPVLFPVMIRTCHKCAKKKRGTVESGLKVSDNVTVLFIFLFYFSLSFKLISD